MPTVRDVDGVDLEYELRRAGDLVAVIFHGGHLRADLPIGQRALVDMGLSVLQPSRPGYGATPLAAGPDHASFADRVALLCADLGYREVVSVGMSAGGRTAMTFASRHPDLVRALVLESATSFDPWPELLTGVAGRIAFRPGVERMTWAVLRVLFRWFPRATLRGMLVSPSSLPPRVVLRRLSPADRVVFVGLLSRMRSGSGFLNDLRSRGAAPEIRQPTLIVASRHDGAVGDHHPRTLHRRIAGSRLVMTDAPSHLLWDGPHADQEHAAVTAFLREVLPHRPPAE